MVQKEIYAIYSIETFFVSDDHRDFLQFWLSRAGAVVARQLIFRVHHAYSKKIVKIPVGLPVAPGTSENFFKYGTREKMKTKASAAQKNSTMIPGFFSVLQLNKMVLFQISKVMTSSHNNNNQNKKNMISTKSQSLLGLLLQQNKCVEQPARAFDPFYITTHNNHYRSAQWSAKFAQKWARSVSGDDFFVFLFWQNCKVSTKVIH